MRYCRRPLPSESLLLSLRPPLSRPEHLRRSTARLLTLRHYRHHDDTSAASCAVLPRGAEAPGRVQASALEYVDSRVPGLAWPDAPDHGHVCVRGLHPNGDKGGRAERWMEVRRTYRIAGQETPEEDGHEALHCDLTYDSRGPRSAKASRLVCSSRAWPVGSLCANRFGFVVHGGARMRHRARGSSPGRHGRRRDPHFKKLYVPRGMLNNRGLTTTTPR